MAYYLSAVQAGLWQVRHKCGSRIVLPLRLSWDKKQGEKLSSVFPLNLHITQPSAGFLHVAAFVGFQSVFVSQGLGLVCPEPLSSFYFLPRCKCCVKAKCDKHMTDLPFPEGFFPPLGYILPFPPPPFSSFQPL